MWCATSKSSEANETLVTRSFVSESHPASGPPTDVAMPTADFEQKS